MTDQRNEQPKLYGERWNGNGPFIPQVFTEQAYRESHDGKGGWEERREPVEIVPFGTVQRLEAEHEATKAELALAEDTATAAYKREAEAIQASAHRSAEHAKVLAGVIERLEEITDCERGDIWAERALRALLSDLKGNGVAMVEPSPDAQAEKR